MRLNVGCGETKKEGYIGVDCRPLPGVVLADMWNVHTLPVCPVEEIYCRHALEHVTFAEGKDALKSFFAALKPGGGVNIVVPDIIDHLGSLFDDPMCNYALGSLYGWQRYPEDVHKAGYTFELLSEFLAEAGFVDIKRRTSGEDSAPEHLNMTARKP